MTLYFLGDGYVACGSIRRTRAGYVACGSIRLRPLPQRKC